VKGSNIQPSHARILKSTKQEFKIYSLIPSTHPNSGQSVVWCMSIIQASCHYPTARNYSRYVGIFGSKFKQYRVINLRNRNYACISRVLHISDLGTISQSKVPGRTTLCWRNGIILILSLASRLKSWYKSIPAISVVRLLCAAPHVFLSLPAHVIKDLACAIEVSWRSRGWLHVHSDLCDS